MTFITFITEEIKLRYLLDIVDACIDGNLDKIDISWKEKFEYWLDEMHKWLEIVGIKKDKTRVREHTDDELSHYSKRTVDIEYETPFGWKELYGLAYRTDFDLKKHTEASGQDLSYFDQESGEKSRNRHAARVGF